VEHIMPLDSTPRIALLRSSMPLAGTTAPGSPSTPTRPRARIGRAADTLERLPVTQIDAEHLSLSACGCSP
jgi:hypothetical protein